MGDTRGPALPDALRAATTIWYVIGAVGLLFSIALVAQDWTQAWWLYRRRGDTGPLTSVLVTAGIGALYALVLPFCAWRLRRRRAASPVPAGVLAIVLSSPVLGFFVYTTAIAAASGEGGAIFSRLALYVWIVVPPWNLALGASLLLALTGVWAIRARRAYAAAASVP